MNKLFVPYELAIKLREKGFDEECIMFFDLIKQLSFFEHYNRTNSTLKVFTTAPLYQQAIQFLLKELDFECPYLRIELYCDGSGNWIQPDDEVTGNPEVDISFDNLDEAIEKGLKLLEK